MQGGAGPSRRYQAAEHPSWKSLSMVSGPLDVALVVRVQPVCTHTFCSFIFCSGHYVFRETSWRGEREECGAMFR